LLIKAFISLRFRFLLFWLFWLFFSLNCCKDKWVGKKAPFSSSFHTTVGREADCLAKSTKSLFSRHALLSTPRSLRNDLSADTLKEEKSICSLIYKDFYRLGWGL
jgi:hypothetical protein